MTTWADFLSDIRADLQDTSTTNKRWTDAMLYVYTKDAIRDYSTWFPKRVDKYAMTLTDGVYALPLNFLQEIRVEAPQDTFLVHRREIPGTKLRTGKYYFIEGGNLYLGDPALDEPYLTYYASREVPASETDETFVFEIPDADMELVRLYVKAKVYEQMRSRQASLDRFKLGNGSRDDNPLTPEVDDLMKVYHEKIAERIPGGNIELYRSRK
jgi:hypothetical protein